MNETSQNKFHSMYVVHGAITLSNGNLTCPAIYLYGTERRPNEHTHDLLVSGRYTSANGIQYFIWL